MSSSDIDTIKSLLLSRDAEFINQAIELNDALDLMSATEIIACTKTDNWSLESINWLLLEII
jgi:hypothetical protein